MGILDLDLQGASVHLFLGVSPGLPREKEGILPLPVAANLSLMSVTAFSGERAMALRGTEVSDAIRELLAVTQWGELDFLLVDMPPGIGDEVLDLARLIPRMEAIVVSTPSTVSIAVVERLLAVLSEMGVRVPGVVANMVRDGSSGGAGDVRPVRRAVCRRGPLRAGDRDGSGRLAPVWPATGAAESPAPRARRDAVPLIPRRAEIARAIGHGARRTW